MTGVRLRAGVSALLADWPLGEKTVPRLLPGKGVSLTADGLSDAFPYVLRTPNRDFACGSHVVPRGDGRVYLGATNRISTTPGGTPGITLGEVHSLLHSAIHEINTGFRTANVRSFTFGMRPLTLDHRPMLGHTGVPPDLVHHGARRAPALRAGPAPRRVRTDARGGVGAAAVLPAGRRRARPRRRRYGTVTAQSSFDNVYYVN